jgi:adenylate cyclase
LYPLSVNYYSPPPEPSAFTFASKGKHSFKNISEEKEVFELITNHPQAFIIDPVCRMIISDEANAVQHPEMAGLLFCSDHFMDIYRRNKGLDSG